MIKRKKPYYYLGIIVTMALGCGKEGEALDQVEPLTDNPLTTALDSAIHSLYLDHVMDDGQVGLSMAVLDGDQTTFYNYGETRTGNGKLPTNESLYELGGLTKTFTALVATKFLVDNDLSIHTPVQRFLPPKLELPVFGDRPITFGHLLNHTSGLPKVPEDLSLDPSNGNPFLDYGYQDVSKYLGSFEPLREPGSRYEYSHLGFMLLAMTVEYNLDAYAGEFYSPITQGIIGMENTDFGLYGILDRPYDIMGAYRENGDQGYYWDMGIWQGAGGLYSNSSDMARYARVHFRSYRDNAYLANLIQRNTIETFHDSDVSIGRAWHLMKLGDESILWHTGSTGGFSATILIAPESEKALVVLSNRAGMEKKLMEGGLDFLKDFLKP